VVQSTLRVDPERVDRLINTVGELIINQSVISQKLQAIGVAANSEIMGALDDYTRLAREIQEGVMSIRAQPVKSLFQRMARVVREAAEATGKQVLLVTEGEATEIDKTVIERLADPLTHMLRNAVDHGIERPEQRSERGKPETGTVRLVAAHRSGHVQIEISDDGAGVNREKVLAKAVKNGLVPPDAKLSDAEIDALLFAPGFSTSDTVTNLSGRGVGMDVVKTSITALGGRVGISSQFGKGSSFSITLPLTMAVLDGMLVDVGAETLVLPLSSIRETVRVRAQDVRRLGPNDVVLSVRGAFVPVIDLGQTLGMASGSSDDASKTFVLVTGEDGATLAVVVDAISDQRQVVIKSLEGNYGAIPGISAATILGSGKVALIVDTDALFTLAANGAGAPAFAEMEG
jgi:two-component system chemotaxis sensor kinase CheA